MRKLVFGALCALALAGCVNQDPFVKAVDTNWQVIGPEYTRYLDQDPALDSESKEIRKRTAETFTKLIQEAKTRYDTAKKE